MDSVESDYKDDLADAVEDLDTEFVVEGNENKHGYQDKEDDSLDSPNYNQPHAIVHESNSADVTKVQNKCSSKEKGKHRKINSLDKV